MDCKHAILFAALQWADIDELKHMHTEQKDMSTRNVRAATSGTLIHMQWCQLTEQRVQ